MPADSAILVVDDSKTMVEFVFKMLREAGYANIDRAFDGLTALTMTKHKKYDLIITDWQMKPISGIDLIKAMKPNLDGTRVRTILITAMQGKDDDAWLDGADGYITKPFAANTLIERVEDAIGKAASEVA